VSVTFCCRIIIVGHAIYSKHYFSKLGPTFPQYGHPLLNTDEGFQHPLALHPCSPYRRQPRTVKLDPCPLNLIVHRCYHLSHLCRPIGLFSLSSIMFLQGVHCPTDIIVQVLNCTLISGSSRTPGYSCAKGLVFSYHIQNWFSDKFFSIVGVGNAWESEMPKNVSENIGDI
jgi:hypothetical protein